MMLIEYQTQSDIRICLRKSCYLESVKSAEIIRTRDRIGLASKCRVYMEIIVNLALERMIRFCPGYLFPYIS